MRQGSGRRGDPVAATAGRSREPRLGDGQCDGRGGKKSGSGRGKTVNKAPARKGGRKGAAARTSASRSAAAKKGWETRPAGTATPSAAAAPGSRGRVRARAARWCASRRAARRGRVRPRGGAAIASRPVVGQAQREAAAVVGIGLALDQPGADQRIDRAADRRRAALHRVGDLAERRRLVRGDRGEQVALLAHRLGRGGVAAQLLDQPREARRERRCR